MNLDKDLMLSEAQAVTVSAASTNSINLQKISALDRYDMRLRATVNTAFAGGTSLQVKVQTDDNSGFSSATDIAMGQVIALANLTAGAVLLDIPFPANGEQYIQGYFTVVGTMSAGKIDFALVSATPTSKSTYPDAVDRF